MEEQQYSLELTENSKAGWAFGLPRSKTCIHKTKICWRLCYGASVRYQSRAQKSKRLRNFNTIEFLLDRGGPELLAENLLLLIDQARPADFIAAQISGKPTRVPWTLRIHDTGDYSERIDYVTAWKIAVDQRPDCLFWFYTRSFLEDELLAALSGLASQPNCQAFLSIDSENFERGLRAFAKYPGIWKLALLQQDEEELAPELLPALQEQILPGQIISFPYHRAGYHVTPIEARPLTLCPQITTGAFPLQRSRLQPKPCQACSLCLPG